MKRHYNKRMMPLPPPRTSVRDKAEGVVEAFRAGIIFLTYFVLGVLGMALAAFAVIALWCAISLLSKTLGMGG